MRCIYGVEIMNKCDPIDVKNNSSELCVASFYK
uniref:Uncharacterized protein n=1 Tax=Arundo donax TaxID=35708 RepID=A0A0A9EYN8_ARUDO